MAVMWQNAGGSLSSDPPHIAKAVNNLVGSITRGAKRAAELSAYLLREQLQMSIKNNSLGLKPISPDTRVTRLAGKLAGNWPERVRVSGNKPLFSTGQTSGSIKVHIKDSVYTVGFDDSVVTTYSKYPLAEAAERQEKGFTIRGNYTKKMLAYLHILFKRKGSAKAKKTWVKTHAGIAFTRRIDPRPAWEKVQEKVEPSILATFKYHITKEINKSGLDVVIT